METGKLYTTQNLYWLLYPSAHNTYTPRAAVLSKEVAQYWCSTGENGEVTYLPRNSLFVVLENGDGSSFYNKRLYRVLTDKGLAGWIYLAEWASHDIVKVEA
jgi:hypothetical protein